MISTEISIIDFGSQFTQLIARRIRELKVYSKIYYPDNFIFQEGCKGIILSGSPQSVEDHAAYAPLLQTVMHLNAKGIPILAICFGHQIICQYLGGTVIKKYTAEYGSTNIIIDNTCLLTNQPNGLQWEIGESIKVWMSHSDSVVELPKGFKKIAFSDSSEFAVIADDNRKIYGLQFHPEVSHTEKGEELINNFLNVTQVERGWEMENFISQQQKKLKTLLEGKKVLAAVSGGVDSTVAAVLLQGIIKDNLKCICIDTGLLRKNEILKISDLFKKNNIEVEFYNAQAEFMQALKGISEPELKRKQIGKTFIEVFERKAREIGKVDFLLQGTLYSDVIESGTKLSAHIKSHHNVGGLPERMNLQIVEPLRFLFKDEVRSLGLKLGLDKSLLDRHPFPGPGLAIRIIGEVTTQKIHILQEIDDIYINLLHKVGLYNKIWQAFAVLLPVKTVGVMGDERTYSYACVLRAVTSLDGMTANCFPFENIEEGKVFWEFLQEVSSKIINQVAGVNRVTYDITSKPPATIEWE